jgi:hypothetical protein
VRRAVDGLPRPGSAIRIRFERRLHLPAGGQRA